MKYLSVCSGIEAASVAWEPLGWTPVGFSEIEPFPSAVLAHRFPGVPNYGDFTTIDPAEVVDADVLVGGTPCQAFSVAGLRGSLDDARGNLSLGFVRLADAIDDLRLSRGAESLRILWENVPGVLNTRDNAFGCFLGGLAGHGKAIVSPDGKRWPDAGVVSGPRRVVAWRILDAQWYGVAQRRRRVFVYALGGAGKWSAADALLPLAEGVQRHPPARPTAGKSVTGTPASRTSAGGGLGTDFDLDGGLIAARLWDTVGALCADTHPGAYSGQDAYTGRLVPVAFDPTQITSAANRSNPQPGDPCHTLTKSAHPPAIAFESRYVRNGRGAPPEDVFPPLKAQSGETGKGDAAPLVAYQVNDSLVPIADTAAGDTLAAQGHDVRGVLVSPSLAYGFQSNDNGWSGGHEELTPTMRGADALGVAVVETNHPDDIAQPVIASTGGVDREDKHTLIAVERTMADDVTHTLRGEGFDASEDGTGRGTPLVCSIQAGATRENPESGPDGVGVSQSGVAYTLEARAEVQCVATFQQSSMTGKGTIGYDAGDVAKPVKTQMDGQMLHTGMVVRRLTPTECARLQGFPDDWARIPWRGKSADQCPDGPQYKAYGNSMATPVIRWLGQRMMATA